MSLMSENEQKNGDCPARQEAVPPQKIQTREENTEIK